MKKEKNIKHGKRNFGIFLILLQLIALFGTFKNNTLSSDNLFRLIGFFLPGIIGIILILKDNEEK